ncbi:MAG: triose-phosphate isomerase [Phycisphaeraceae bacterium]
MSRKPFVGGNWKMNLDCGGAKQLAHAITTGLSEWGKVDVAVFPPFPYLSEVGNILAQVPTSGIKLGAQDFYFEKNGAYTGEVSLAMLKDVGCSVVLVGHSERRHVIGESDVLLNRKVLAALGAGFEVILCVGEKLEQREAGMTDAVNMAQTMYGLAGVKAEQMKHVTIAYEPVWAIGTGKTATTADAQAAHAAIRACVNFGCFGGGTQGKAIADAVRIQYGGSVKSSNARELFAQPDIDGGLIGGAALKAEDFLPIIKAAM